MTTTTDRPLFVDGVRLDTLAWNIAKIERAVASRRTYDAEVPGLDGVIPSLNDTLEAGSLGLEMFVRGSNQDGGAATDKRAQFKANLDRLVHLFGKRHALLEVWEQQDANQPLTNTVLNPVFGNAIQRWAVARIAAAHDTAVFETSPASMRLTGNGDTTGEAYAYPGGPTPILRHPAAPLDRVSTRVRVRAGSAGASVRLTHQGYNDAGGGVGSVFGSSAQTAVAANTWVTVEVANAQVPNTAGITNYLPLVYVRNADGTLVIPAATDILWIDRMDTYNTGPGLLVGTIPAFSGASASDATWQYEWAPSYAFTGTAHDSPSTRTPKTMRRIRAKVVDSIAPDLATHGQHGTFAVGLVVPSGVWEDVVAQDWSGTAGAASGARQYPSTLLGGTERTTDAVVLVTGPATNPRVTDLASGAWVQLNRAVAAGEVWRFNCATWASRVGGLALGSTDTTGTDVVGQTVTGGAPGYAHPLPLTPAHFSPLDPTRQVGVSLTGTSFTTATRLHLRTRRKYAL